MRYNSRLSLKEEFIFYFGAESIFSHWFKSNFFIRDKIFCCVGQYLMYQKAFLFNDQTIAEKILRSSDPRRHRRLGREVTRFKKELWHCRCKEFAFTAEHARFSQNPHLIKALLETQGKTLAEASPYDRNWGIGLSMGNPKIHDRSQWRGKNWAGEVLESVRDKLSDETVLELC